MADDDPAPNETKTPTDLALERLSARLDALESENRELREANQGLWNALHTAPAEPVPTTEATPEPKADEAFDSFNKIIGMKE